MRRIKRKYNKWLFKKYGFNVGLFYEKIPKIWRLIPLFSPSLYTYAQGQQIYAWFIEGVKQGLKNENRIDISEEIASDPNECRRVYDAVLNGYTNIPKE